MNSYFNGIVLAAAVLVSAVSVAADKKHDHHGSHGGQVRESVSHDLELVTKDKELSLYVRDHAGKKIDTKGASATAIVTTGKARETVKLVPGGDNVLKGSGGFTLAPDTKVLVSITVGGKTDQARFSPMEKEKAADHKGHRH